MTKRHKGPKPRWMQQWDDDKPKVYAGYKKHLEMKAQGQVILDRSKPVPAPVASIPPAIPVKYDEYINSPEWAAFRVRWFAEQRLPNLCVACSGSSMLELHHVTYQRLGAERMNDVVPLCHRCHKEFHARYSSHDCTGLDWFRSQLRIAFNLSREIVAIRLRPFLEFTPRQPKQVKAEKAQEMTRRERRNEKKRDAKRKQKISNQVRFHQRMCQEKPRHDPYS